MIGKWLHDLAAVFWEEVGDLPPFPRDLEHLIHCHKPVTVVRLENLTPSSVLDWLSWRGFRLNLVTQDRQLNGCLVAADEHGFLFVEESLPADDDRMIVAHELAHYLADYEYPRHRARRRLGPGVLSLFDGRRRPTPLEGVQGALAGVAIGPHVHCMERGTKGTYSEGTSQVEENANLLAFELIAPWRAVVATVAASDRDCLERWSDALQNKFGLPSSWAEPYALRLTTHARATRSFSRTLGL
jgi:hypothetical protein